MGAHVVLTVRDGTRAGERHEFDAPGTYLIGRAEECALRLTGDPEFLPVSRRHCLLEVDPPAARVRDLESRNGTRLNGMQIGRPASWRLAPELSAEPCRPYDLRDGDELRVGHTVLSVAIRPEDCDEAGAPEDEPACAGA
jgi:eukaryotic-like serine/threonine-protein kinase